MTTCITRLHIIVCLVLLTPLANGDKFDTIESDGESTTKIPALDTVDIIIISVTCAAAAGCITLVGVAAILSHRKKLKTSKITPDFQEHTDAEAIITKTPWTVDNNAEEYMTSMSEQNQQQEE